MRLLDVPRALLLGAQLLLLLSAAGPLWASSNTVPDWVRLAAQQKLPPFPDTAKAVVLLSETTYTVAPDGKATTHVRKVVKILRPQGREYGYPQVWFDKDSKVLSMHVWSIDPAGHEYALKDNEIREFSPPGEGGQLYVDEKAKVADPPGRDPGGVIAVEYELRNRPYLAETNWEFQDELPRLNQSFTLVLPPGYTYTTTWAHHRQVEGADLENHHYRWEMNNESAIDLERVPLSPATGSLTSRMSVHYSGPGLMEPQDGTWQGIGEWYDTLAHDRIVATPDIAAKASELTAGKTDFYDKAEAIGNFVQGKIRYFVIEMGVGGYQPHTAEDIFRGKYGDCKDKATLLSAMLSSVGIHGALVMVDTERGVIDPKDPSIVGSHMIGAIEVPKGYESPKLHAVVTAKTGKRYLIFDPTWEETPFGQLENNLQGSYGVLLEGSASQVIELPVMNPELNTVRRTASLHLEADGVLKGTVTEKRFGDLAERERWVFLHEDAAKQQQYIDRSVAKDMAAASVSDLKVQNAETLSKDLTMSFDLHAEHFANNVGPLLMVRPRILGSYGLPVDREPRKVAIDLHETMQGTDEFDIELPEGYVVDELPDPVKADLGFASYVSSSELRGRTLHYSRTFTLREMTLPPEKYEDVRHLASLIAADESSRAVLKRSQ
ncbi:MAG: DUF3857 domain-containing transglutaminase family protein [Janthinobacterium lividum]